MSEGREGEAKGRGSFPLSLARSHFAFAHVTLRIESGPNAIGYMPIEIYTRVIQI